MAYRVLLYERSRILMEQIRATVEKTTGFELVAHYQTASEALGQGVVFQPNLILLDAEGGSALSVLSEFRRIYPQASILCMGEEWQAERASHFVQAGAKGYIVKPFSSEELQDAVETFAKSGMEVAAETYTFFSPKGKSGKTTLIANLAMALARRTHEQVGIIDADLQFGDMAVFFNLQPASTIVEAVRDSRFLSPVTLSSYFMPVTKNVHVLCGTRAPNLIDRVSIAGFEKVVKMAQSLYRYLLIDVPQAFNPTSIAAAELSTVTFLVAMKNDGYEMYHMMRAIEIFKDWKDVHERLKPVFTRVTPCTPQAQQELSSRLGFPVAAVIPNAYDVVSAAADNGRMALDIEPDSELSKSVARLADRIVHGAPHAAWAQP
ncbi:response regulator [uncultured Selenomonas sp.]|jgi:pilus assembly protein CpaE|uniref:response regulator n=1 Tax=uncultured Selenomonas sp. TaxID=159275 RepID=UPI0025E3F4CB|nr:response regulator [uncultured Selenomonas sp.]